MAIGGVDVADEAGVIALSVLGAVVVGLITVFGPRALSRKRLDWGVIEPTFRIRGARTGQQQAASPERVPPAQLQQLLVVITNSGRKEILKEDLSRLAIVPPEAGAATIVSAGRYSAKPKSLPFTVQLTTTGEVEITLSGALNPHDMLVVVVTCEDYTDAPPEVEAHVGGGSIGRWRLGISRKPRFAGIAMATLGISTALPGCWAHSWLMVAAGGFSFITGLSVHALARYRARKRREQILGKDAD